MEINYKLNKSLFGLNGILNRRNFIANYLILNGIITAIFASPLIFVFILNPHLLKQILGLEKLSVIFAAFIIIWVLLYCAVKLFCYYPIILKRIRDIVGENQEIKSHLISVIILFLVFAGEVSSNNNGGLIQLISLISIISIMCIEGKKSSKLEKDEVAKFNWGAFLGTWMWGIYNKCYKALWALPLFFTPGFFYFSIACGIKGNEWVYKNVQTEDITKFHEDQRKQSVIWSILGPIFNIFITIIIVIGSIFGFNSYVKTHPEFKNKIPKYFVEISSMKAQMSFDKIDIDSDEYKFYIEPKSWDSYTDREKSNIFKSAGAYVVDKKSMSPKIDIPSDVLAKVKIYSTFNNEILGEYVIPQNKKEGDEYSRFKFNLHPSMP